MYTASFFRTKLGNASLASIAAMVAMIALTSQMNLGLEDAHIAGPSAGPNADSAIMVELA